MFTKNILKSLSAKKSYQTANQVYFLNNIFVQLAFSMSNWQKVQLNTD